MEVSEFNTVIHSRRSIYPYQFEKGKIIPDEIIWQLLENANRAPTHKLTEPWRFTVFSGNGLKYLARVQSQIYKESAGEKFKESKLKKLTEYPLLSSHVIVVSMKRSVEVKIPVIEEIIATACAVENIYLSAAAYHLACYFSTGGVTYFEQAKSFFNLQNDDHLIGSFYLGYPGDIRNPLSKRDPVSEKVRWIRSGEL